MLFFCQLLLNGILLGNIYALVAVGYSLVFSVMKLVNFAHGDVLMIGAFVALSVWGACLSSGLPIWVSFITMILVSLIICGFIGVVMERVAYRSLRNSRCVTPITTTVALSILLQALSLLIWGRGYRVFPQPVSNVQIFSYGNGSLVLTYNHLFQLSLSALLFIALFTVLYRTRIGLAMRAVSESQDWAALIGIRINRIMSLTFLLGSALAALSGIIVSMNYGVIHYAMGVELGMKAFIAAIFGGIGRIHGALIGGLVLGILESLGTGYIGDIWAGAVTSSRRDILIFSLLLFFLVLAPHGALPQKMGSRS